MKKKIHPSKYQLNVQMSNEKIIKNIETTNKKLHGTTIIADYSTHPAWTGDTSGHMKKEGRAKKFENIYGKIK